MISKPGSRDATEVRRVHPGVRTHRPAVHRPVAALPATESPAIRKPAGHGHVRNQLLDARLSIGDATAYLTSTPRQVTDWVMYWVFDNGPAGAPSAVELTDQLLGRARYLTALDRHVADVPANLGNPYWVAGSSPLAERVRIDERTTSWTAALDAMARVFTAPLDLHDATWRLAGFSDVTGAPGALGSSTVVFAQVSHSVLVGAQIEGMSRALFGANPMPLDIAGLGDPLPRPRPIRGALLGAARFPSEFARWQGRHLRAAVRRHGPGLPDLATERTPTSFNGVPSPDGMAGPPRVRVIRPEIAEGRRRGVTVTALGLAAISLAIQRYFRDVGQDCPDDLAGLVMVAVDDPRRVLGVNRVNAVQAELYPSVADSAARARAIHAGLRYARTSRQAAATERFETGAATPFAVYPTLLRRVENLPRPAYWATAVTSVRRVGGTADWSLAGRPHAFGGHLINTGADLGLVHSFVGGSDDLTVSIIASAAVVERVDTYAELLDEAFTEVGAALRRSPVIPRLRSVRQSGAPTTSTP